MGTSFLPPDAVLSCFADISQVSVSDLRSRSASRIISYHRQLAMWILRRMTSLTMREIGVLLGGRTAATIKEGIERIDSMIAADHLDRNELYAVLLLVGMRVGDQADTPSPATEMKITAAVGVLADAALSDADARIAALSILRTRSEVARHG